MRRLNPAPPAKKVNQVSGLIDLAHLGRMFRVVEIETDGQLFDAVFGTNPMARRSYWYDRVVPRINEELGVLFEHFATCSGASKATATDGGQGDRVVTLYDAKGEVLTYPIPEFLFKALAKSVSQLHRRVPTVNTKRMAWGLLVLIYGLEGFMLRMESDPECGQVLGMLYSEAAKVVPSDALLAAATDAHMVPAWVGEGNDLKRVLLIPRPVEGIPVKQIGELVGKQGRARKAVDGVVPQSIEQQQAGRARVQSLITRLPWSNRDTDGKAYSRWYVPGSSAEWLVVSGNIIDPLTGDNRAPSWLESSAKLIAKVPSENIQLWGYTRTTPTQPYEFRSFTLHDIEHPDPTNPRLSGVGDMRWKPKSLDKKIPAGTGVAARTKSHISRLPSVQNKLDNRLRSRWYIPGTAVEWLAIAGNITDEYGYNRAPSVLNQKGVFAETPSEYIQMWGYFRDDEAEPFVMKQFSLEEIENSAAKYGAPAVADPKWKAVMLQDYSYSQVPKTKSAPTPILDERRGLSMPTFLEDRAALIAQAAGNYDSTYLDRVKKRPKMNMPERLIPRGGMRKLAPLGSTGERPPRPWKELALDLALFTRSEPNEFGAQTTVPAFNSYMPGRVIYTQLGAEGPVWYISNIYKPSGTNTWYANALFTPKLSSQEPENTPRWVRFQVGALYRAEEEPKWLVEKMEIHGEGDLSDRGYEPYTSPGMKDFPRSLKIYQIDLNRINRLDPGAKAVAAAVTDRRVVDGKQQLIAKPSEIRKRMLQGLKFRVPDSSGEASFVYMTQKDGSGPVWIPTQGAVINSDSQRPIAQVEWMTRNKLLLTEPSQVVLYGAYRSAPESEWVMQKFTLADLLAAEKQTQLPVQVFRVSRDPHQTIPLAQVAQQISSRGTLAWMATSLSSSDIATIRSVLTEKEVPRFNSLLEAGATPSNSPELQGYVDAAHLRMSMVDWSTSKLSAAVTQMMAVGRYEQLYGVNVSSVFDSFPSDQTLPMTIWLARETLVRKSLEEDESYQAIPPELRATSPLTPQIRDAVRRSVDVILSERIEKLFNRMLEARIQKTGFEKIVGSELGKIPKLTSAG